MTWSDAGIEHLLEQLNPEQRAAAEHDLRPLLIIAGAGTGKTTTLVHRVAVQLHRGIHPSRIMLLTFTRRSAQQMIERTRRLDVRRGDLEGVWAGTFHAISVRLLRTFSEALGIPNRFTVHDRGDAEDFLEGIFSKYKKTHPNPSLPKKGTALNIHSFQVNSQWPLEKVIVDNFPSIKEKRKRSKSSFINTKCKRSRLECLTTTTCCLPCAICAAIQR